MFLLIEFGVAVHFKQHSSLTYQNSTFFIGQRTGVAGITELWIYGIMELWNYGIMEALPIQRVVRSQPIANSQ